MNNIRKVLIVKTSSMGDVIHTLPALTDAANALPGIRFDWVVEEGFSEIPHWHPAVDQVIPVALRRWRKKPLQALNTGQWQQFRNALKAQSYDAIIDAQGLIKSAFLTRLTRGKRFGLDKHSAREPLAAHFYHYPQPIPKGLHAVERIRQLFARSLNYPEPKQTGKFQLDKTQFCRQSAYHSPYLVFVHGTSRDDKLWPEEYWCKLAKIAIRAGYQILLPWGSPAEKERANRLADAMNTHGMSDSSISNKSDSNEENRAIVLPKLRLSQVAAILAKACAVVAVDTGLGHLTAALEVPSVSLYGPTSPILVGTYGDKQVHLTPAEGVIRPGQSAYPSNINPFQNITANLVWQYLQPLLDIKPSSHPEPLLNTPEPLQ